MDIELKNNLLELLNEHREYFIEEMGGKSCWTSNIDELIEDINESYNHE